MAYTHYQDSKPDVSDIGSDLVEDIRQNFMALRDALVAGAVYGWDMTPSGGTADQPVVIKFNRGTSEYLKLALTWGTTGGEEGNVTVCVFSYSTDDSIYDTIGMLTMTYTSEGFVTAASWS